MLRASEEFMYLSDITFALKNLLLAGFREPSLLWQVAPILLLWVILVFYFATHKHEKLGWNTSLANGISLFWVVVSGMQHIFSDDGAHFSWVKFIVFSIITVYALAIVYVSFQHKLPATWTYGLASHNLIYYLSYLSILYAHDMIYPTLPMVVAIVLLFGMVLLAVFFLHKLLPAMKEDIEDQLTQSIPEQYEPETSSPLGPQESIETSIGKNTFSDSTARF